MVAAKGSWDKTVRSQGLQADQGSGAWESIATEG